MCGGAEWAWSDPRRPSASRPRLGSHGRATLAVSSMSCARLRIRGVRVRPASHSSRGPTLGIDCCVGPLPGAATQTGRDWDGVLVAATAAQRRSGHLNSASIARTRRSAVHRSVRWEGGVYLVSLTLSMEAIRSAARGGLIALRGVGVVRFHRDCSRARPARSRRMPGLVGELVVPRIGTSSWRRSDVVVGAAGPILGLAARIVVDVAVDAAAVAAPKSMA
jgi:hypothetical protein